MAGILDAFKNVGADSKEVDTSKKVRVGIIGTGWIAEAHVAEYKKMSDVEIVAAADLVPGKAEEFCKRFELEGVKYYGKHTEMLADLDELKLDAISVAMKLKALLLTSS